MTDTNFAELVVKPVDKQIAKDICIKNHYSHKWNTPFGTRCYGVFKDDVLLGVAVYGYPMNPKSWKTITKSDPDKCIELNRLWIDDCLGKNTESWFISATFALLKAEGYLLVQSFADGRLGVGTIYQATNFGYYGAHTTTFHTIKTGEILHNAKFNDTSNPLGMIWRNMLHAEKKTQTFKVMTYRYLYGLTKRAKKDILLDAEPYPKERVGLIPIPDYQPPALQVARAALLAKLKFRNDDYETLMQYLSTLTNDPDAVIQSAETNEWIAAMQEEENKLDMERLF